MGNISKRLISLLFAVSLVCLQAVPVFAQGTEGTTLGISSVMDSGGETQESDDVSTWDELVAWMKAHANVGGNVRLAAPIAFDGKYEALTRAPGAQPATLDLGEFGLTVSGGLDIYSPGLTIYGQGGENASLRVLPGAWVGLSYIDAEPGTNGPVIWQDEGGILALEQPMAAGVVHFATRPIAEPADLGPRVISVMPGENAADKLPEAMQVRVYFEGDAQDEELPVVWNLTDEETAESLAGRRRTLVHGEFADIDTFGVISCILTFLDRPITFTDVLAQNYKGARTIDADFTRPADTFTAAVEYSFDEERWETAQQSEFAANDEAEVMLHFYGSNEAEEGNLIWDTEQNPTLYLRIHWLDAPDGAEVYSDELAFDCETMAISSDTGGNRGGGTDLDPPVTLPPPIGGDGIGGGDDSATETPDPPPETPSGGGSPSDSESGSSSDTPPLLHPDTVPSEPPIPPPSLPAKVSEPVRDNPGEPSSQAQSNFDISNENMPTELGEATSSTAMESLESTQEALAPVTQKPPMSGKAAGQAAAGAVATGGVIALAMTYPHWGKRLTAFLRRLVGK